jgi:hypothetical protein
MPPVTSIETSDIHNTTVTLLALIFTLGTLFNFHLFTAIYHSEIRPRDFAYIILTIVALIYIGCYIIIQNTDLSLVL